MMELTQPIFGRNHQVFCNNYFTSIPLFHTLLNYHTYACCTIRINKKKNYPKDLLTDSKKVSRGEYRLRLEGNLVASIRPSYAATELLPPTLPRLDHLPARGDISRRCVYCQKKRKVWPPDGEVAYWSAMPVLRSHICA